MLMYNTSASYMVLDSAGIRYTAGIVDWHIRALLYVCVLKITTTVQRLP